MTVKKIIKRESIYRQVDRKATEQASKGAM